MISKKRVGLTATLRRLSLSALMLPLGAEDATEFSLQHTEWGELQKKLRCSGTTHMLSHAAPEPEAAESPDSFDQVLWQLTGCDNRTPRVIVRFVWSIAYCGWKALQTSGKPIITMTAASYEQWEWQLPPYLSRAGMGVMAGLPVPFMSTALCRL